MQVTYDGEHSLLIGDLVQSSVADNFNRHVERYDPMKFVSTWDYYHLIPQTSPLIDPPSVQENTVEVPGSNGVVDLSDVLLGHPLYYNRSGSLDFYVDHTFSWTWDTAYDTLLNDLHGFKKKVILQDARGFYYDGRLSVNSWKSDKLCSSITLDYNFAPYKRMLFTSGEDWLWDPFDFVNGIIVDRESTYELTVAANSAGTLCFNRLTAGVMPVVPDILLTADDVLSNLNNVKLMVYTSSISETDAATKVVTDGKEYDLSDATIGTSGRYWLEHNPLIVVGGPVEKWTAIRLVNNSSTSIKMAIDFRQGRL